MAKKYSRTITQTLVKHTVQRIIDAGNCTRAPWSLANINQTRRWGGCIPPFPTPSIFPSTFLTNVLHYLFIMTRPAVLLCQAHHNCATIYPVHKWMNFTSYFFQYQQAVQLQTPCCWVCGLISYHKCHIFWLIRPRRFLLVSYHHFPSAYLRKTL